MLLWLASSALFMATVASGATTYRLKTYETSAQYLVGNFGQKIRCSTSGNALTFNILQGVSGGSGHKSFRSTTYRSTYIVGDDKVQFIRLLRLQSGYLFGLLASFKERKNHFFQGTSSYESIVYPGYYMMCTSGQLQLGQPNTNKQAMRASFVLEDEKPVQSLWKDCSRTCGGGTQARQQVCVFGFCEDVQTRKCNTQKCPSSSSCIPNPCQNGGKCSTNFWGNVRCNCPHGFEGNRCEIRIHPCDLQNPCQNKGKCRKVGLNYKCECKNGYTGVHCETAPHPCDSHPCRHGGTCIRFQKGYVCQCPPLYTGQNCETPKDPCDNKPCLNGGDCQVVGVTSFECNCKPFFTGPFCETPVPNPCDSHPCQNAGKCVRKGANDFRCHCRQGFTGRLCQTRVNPCDSHPCQNGGTCKRKGANDFRCTCRQGFTGRLCQTRVNPCDSHPCQNGGDCERKGLNDFTCRCKQEFTGQFCESQVVNPCRNNPCQNGGSCVRSGHSDFSCTCPSEFTGNFCQDKVPDPCSSDPCLNGGTCVRHSKSFVCSCTESFTGQTCETLVNPCRNNPCQNGGNCVRSGHSDFSCTCPSEFTGNFCQDKVPDPCSSDPCLNGGTCVPHSKSFVCSCTGSFTGQTCETPTRPSCTSSYCQNGGTCIELNSGLKCKCAPGWQGSRCQDAVQGFQWSACSKTCGPGTRYRKCRSDDPRRCERRYEDCNLKACPNVHCTTYRFDTATECCSNPTSAQCGVPSPPGTARRVIGGVKSNVAQWPWQIAMWKKVPKIFFCGGALVSNAWVVTAGHCARMSGVAQHEMQIVAGVNQLSGSTTHMQTSDVEKIITHPNFNNPVDDIALLKLTKPFTFTQYVKPICFPQGEVVDCDVICYAAGWGASSEADITARRPSNDLLHVGLRTLPRDACVQGFKRTAFASGVTDRVLCAGVLKGGKDTCIGDSGGPYVCQRRNSCQWYLAGIGSFGPTQCGIGYIPAVFMDVAKYEKWLKDQIAKN